VLLGTAKEPLREATVHQSASRQLAIRQGPWKLVFAGKGQRENALYDLATDIGESRNVAGEHPEIVARLTALMQRFIAEGRSTPGAAQPAEAGVTWPVP
jgi:arylsulfatase A